MESEVRKMKHKDYIITNLTESDMAMLKKNGINHKAVREKDGSNTCKFTERNFARACIRLMMITEQFSN